MMATSSAACMEKLKLPTTDDCRKEMLMDAVVVEHLAKAYGRVQALNDLSFGVKQGELYGIIGPDGAGKTTLFRILTTLMLADKGTARVAGMDVVADYRAIRRIIGYMPGRFSLYQDLTVEENLQFFAAVFHTTLKENYHLIEDIYRQIEPFKHRLAGKLSGGMKQKLALSCALIHKPEVLFLDEPTTGVDPVSRKELWGMLLKLKRQGITIVVSTLCDRIALIQDGRFLKVDTPQHIVGQYPDSLWAVCSDRMHRLLYDLQAFAPVKSSFSFGATYHVTLADDGTPEDLRRYLEQCGHSSVDIRQIQPSVEDCFMLWSGK